MKDNNLLERYVHAVGRELSDKEREDIEMELRSNLYDTLEERGLDADADKDQEAIAEMIKEFGAPKEIADAYRKPRYLIGPRFFPIYAQVVKILSLVMVGAVSLLALLRGLQGQTLVGQISGLFGDYLGAIIPGLVITTLVFFVIERSEVAEEELEAEQAEDWDPRNLPAVVDEDRVDYFDLTMGLLFGLGFLFVVNSVFGLIGPQSDFIQGLEQSKAPLERLGFLAPYLAGIIGVEVLLTALVLVRGSWLRGFRWLEFAVSAAYVALFALSLMQGPFSELRWLDLTIRSSAAIALVITAGIGAGQLYRLLRPERGALWKLAPKAE